MFELNESLFTITPLTHEEQIAEVNRRAESAKYISAPFKCTVCYRGFVNEDAYRAHQIKHNEAAGAYECNICKTRSKSSKSLRTHMTALHSVKISCKECPFTTKVRTVAREHEKWHAGTAKYQCPHCPCEFDKKSTFKGHIRIKHVSDFVCELCGYTFISQKGVEVHKMLKHRIIVGNNIKLEGPYCEVCDIKFLSEEAHSRHLKVSSKHTSDNDPNRLRNDFQSKGTVGSIRPRERRVAIRPKDDQCKDVKSSVTCEQCGLELQDFRYYSQHFRRAHPDKIRTQYSAITHTHCMCESCGRMFQNMALLKEHMAVHTGEKRLKKFKCDICDKSFARKPNLNLHKRIHNATRPTFECPICGKHFLFYRNKKKHMFIHTGLKPFKCDTCDKSFTTQAQQRAHNDHVHLKKPWPKRDRQRTRKEAWNTYSQEDEEA